MLGFGSLNLSASCCSNFSSKPTFVILMFNEDRLKIIQTSLILEQLENKLTTAKIRNEKTWLFLSNLNCNYDVIKIYHHLSF